MLEEPRGLVYLLDADAGVRNGLRAMLHSHGYRVACYDSAETFLAARTEQSNACMLTEIKLPGLSGIELLERLRGEGRALPVIVMAAQGSVSAAVSAMRAGALDFLEKPFSQRQLLERIAEALATVSA